MYHDVVLILAGLITLASCQSTPVSKTKAYVRIGVLYDSKNKDVAEGVRDEISLYAQRYNISETFTTEAIMLLIDSTTPDSLQNSNLSAVFVSSSSLNCSTFQTVIYVLPFFYVSGSSSSCDFNITYNRVIYMMPSHSVLITAMLNTMIRYSWPSATVLYQSNDEIQYTFQDMQDAGNRGIEVSAYEAVGSDTDIKQKLIAARRKGSRTYVFVCSYTRLVKLMSIARELRLSTSNNHWFIPNVLIDPLVLQDFLKDGVKITFLHSPLVTPLTSKIVKNDESLLQDDRRFFKSVVMALSRIAMRSLVETCQHTQKQHTVYRDSDGRCFSSLTSNSNTYSFCGPDFMTNLTVSSNNTGAQVGSGYGTETRSNHISSTTKRVQFDESCIIYNINDTDVPASLGTVANSSSNSTNSLSRAKRHGYVQSAAGWIMNNEITRVTDGSNDTTSMARHGRAGSSSNPNGAKQLSISANFDPCTYPSVYKWQYQNLTCSDTFFTSLKPLDSNAVFVIEHVQSTTKKDEPHELLAVGGYNGGRSELSTTYPKYKASYIQLPERDFIVCVVWNPPWLLWEYDPITLEPIPGSYKGFLFDMLKELAASMKFNYVMHNGSAVEFAKGYNHTAEQLEKRMDELFNADVCDLFLAAITIHGGRLAKEDGVGLSKAFQQPRLYLLTKRVERNQNVSIWQFLTPFKEESWVILYASLFLVSLYMTFINKKNPNEFRRAARELREGAKHSEHMGIMNSLWFNYAVLVQQASQLMPKSLSLKIMSGCWWCFVLLVVSAYTANMISFMTQTDNEGITKVEQLVSQQEYEYGMVDTNPLLTKLLPQARNAPYSTMWEQLKKKLNSSVFPNIDGALKRVFVGDYILVATFQETVQSIAKSCDYDKVGDGFYKYQYGLPVPRGWQFLTLLNDHISNIYDSGVLSELELKWFGDIEGRCEKKEEANTVAGQLDLKAFIGMYVFLSLGVTGGIIVCIFETIYVKYGGFGGLTGRAKKYEFRQNHIEHQKPDKLMEKEFENWPGGWEVIKHRPFVNTISDMIDTSPRNRSASVVTDRATSSAMLITSSTRYRGDIEDNRRCCPGCGREDIETSTT